MRRTLLFIFALFVCHLSLVAQDSIPSFLDNRGNDAKFAPRLSLGSGFFTYLGDVQDNNIDHPFTSSWGYEFKASSNISRYFDIDLNVIYGNITVNERTRERNLNFRSELFIGGVGVTYNFSHLYKKRPGIVQPFVSLGVSFIHFDSKTDTRDADGNVYHYWSDGSIMSMAENSEQSSQAIELQRDYYFESDLRQMNNDGLGKYDLFTFSVPVSFGVEFKMGRRVSGRLSSAFYYTFTDLIDDFTWRGAGEREGNKANDMFFYTSLSVAYSLGVQGTTSKVPKDLYFEDHDYMALYLADSDSDGVNDFLDMCAQTPSGVEVDELGCPLDNDTDLIPNFRDEEAITGMDMIANLKGLGLTDAMMLERYADSIATVRARIALIYPQGIWDKNGVEMPTQTKESAIAQQIPLSVSTTETTVAATKTAAQKDSDSDQSETVVAASREEVANQTDGDIKSDAKEPVVQTEDLKSLKSTETIRQSEVTKATEASTMAVQTPSSESIDSTPEKKDAVVVKRTTQQDAARLSQVMNTIAKDAGRKSETGKLMDEIAKEVFKSSAKEAADLDEVYSTAYRVYGKMIDDGRIDHNTSLNIIRNAPISDIIPQEFRIVDLNDDGLLSPDEVMRAIEEVIDGESVLSVDQVFDMVEFYQKYMEDARVIDFGGTRVVYVNKRLNILPNVKDDGLSNSERFLVRKFAAVDYNGDGKLTADEVNRVIAEHQAGSKAFTKEQINDLIDLYFED